MRQQILRRLFRECLKRSYRETDTGASWDFSRRGNTLFLYFEKSNGARDWLSNLTFHATPYRDMSPPWKCHSGFWNRFESVKPHIRALISDPTVGRVVTVGYSHGAALAVLCHEFIYYNRPDIRDQIFGFGFGCPRVIYGELPPELAARWERFFVIRNLDDLVTHLPPSVLGYTHVGNLITVGAPDRYNAIDAHREKNYLREL